MKLKPAELWDAWQTSAEIREVAEGWITKQQNDWTEDDKRLYSTLKSSPDQMLATIFAIMQMTDDETVLANLAAGPLEDFLGRHGEMCLEAIEALAKAHKRLREVLNGVWQGAMTKRVWHRIEILKQSAYS